MANHGCVNGTLDGANYSSAVPVIGLYIAAASLVCMLLMLYDIVSEFRARQRWLPCKLFSLNSVTLTLLSIATKLPADLITPMPSPEGQLSKLCGTILLVIAMGFLLPSVGINNESECFTNLAALTIFVITVVINICIQISTGVIVLFIVEHIITMCCMWLLLMMLWFSAGDINNRKWISFDRNKEIFTKGNGSMFERLKTSYSFGYCSNPQLVLSSESSCLVGGILCPICSAILIYVAIKSLILKQLDFCLGISDYKWSMSIIVVTQILTTVIGSFAIIFRWLTLFKHMQPDWLTDFVDQEVDIVIGKNPILGIVSTVDKYCRVLRNIYLNTVKWVQVLIVVIPVAVTVYFFVSIFDNIETDIKEWTEKKSMEDMERLLVACKSESTNHLSQLLSRTHPSHQLHTMEIRDQAHLNQEGVKVSSLSIVLLVRIAQVSLPNSLCGSLVQVFNEANEIIHFVDKTIKSKSLENDKKLLFAKAVWVGNDFSCLLPKNVDTSIYQPQSDLERAVIIITKLKNILPDDIVWCELGIIMDFINRKKYSSIEDLHGFIEQMFVDMLHMVLAQLPISIFKVLSDNHVEDYEESVKFALKILCKIETTEAQIQWSFPAGCNISRFITTVESELANV